MKIWNGYGSEHSEDLIMIGHFKAEANAQEAKRAFERIVEQVSAEPDTYASGSLDGDTQLSDQMLALLRELELYSFCIPDIEQFAYDFSLTQEGKDLVLKTDECHVGGFLKIMLDRSAKVEIYSAHDYPTTAE